MKIRFKKKRLYANLIIGIIWIGLCVFNVFEHDSFRWLDYVHLIMGLLYTAHFLYDLKHEYLSIENGTIKKNRLYGFEKKINLDDVNWIKKYAGDYIIKTETKDLKINTELIDENSLTELNRVLGQLNLPDHKSPFAYNV